jgi:3',5'-cyclic AMP phosphodiesterase CpdA
MQTVTFAHLSDVHLPPLPGLTPAHWNVKRTLGWLNWQRKRRFVHTRAALDLLVADVKAQAPDHILVSGDLINIGLPAEYAAARDWLATLGAPGQVSVVPGNHDTYCDDEAGPGTGLWAAHTTGSEPWRVLVDDGYPYLREVGPVAVIGVNSGVATPLGSAAGEVGPAQRSRLARLLEATKAAGLVRLVMIHHPPVPGLATPSRALHDAEQLAGVLAAKGAELVVHGHNHRMMSATHAGIAIEGVASASASRSLGHEPTARYNQITITAGTNATTIKIETRGLDTAAKAIVPIASRVVRG